MRTVVLNDTSAWHSGSAAATAALFEILEGDGHEVVGKIATKTPNLAVFGRELLESRAPGLVVIHGEGTMNRDSPVGTTFLELATLAKVRGAVVFLVNALWAGMSPKWATLVRNFDRVFVRDPESQGALEAEGVTVAGVRVDLSVNLMEPELEEGLALMPERKGTSAGDGVTGRPLPWFPDGARRVSLRDLEWRDAIRAIRTTALYVTGEHHGAIAAGLAGVPFAAMEQETHKLRALYAWAHVEIPLPKNAKELEDAAEWAWTPRGRREQDRFARWLRLYAPRLSSTDIEV